MTLAEKVLKYELELEEQNRQLVENTKVLYANALLIRRKAKATEEQVKKFLAQGKEIGGAAGSLMVGYAAVELAKIREANDKNEEDFLKILDMAKKLGIEEELSEIA